MKTKTLQKCTVCKVGKELTPEFFFRNASNIYNQGFMYQCKECARNYTRTWRLNHPQEYKAQMIRRRLSDGAKQYRINNKPRFKAPSAVYRAIKSGKLIKKPCEICGELKVQAHHYMGYEVEHQLDVRWLCRIHHLEVHGRVV